LRKYKLIPQFKFLQNLENQFELERIELQTKSDSFSSRANKNRQVEFWIYMVRFICDRKFRLAKRFYAGAPSTPFYIPSEN